MSAQRSFRYSIYQCDVDGDKAALQRFRDKRMVWENWLEGNPDHAIWANISQLVWREVAFGTLAHIADSQQSSALHNSLITEAVLHGHVALQAMTIRRLMDTAKSTISLLRLVRDIRQNIDLFTREHYVCYDGLPYDYQAVMDAEFAKLRGVTVRWGDTTGPNAWGASQHAHTAFDRLCGIAPSKRQRTDRMPSQILDTVEQWIEDSGAKGVQKWTHDYLAHASLMDSRKMRDDYSLSGGKIGEAIRGLSRATEAISAHVLYMGGRLNSLMPVPQFDVFDSLEKPVLAPYVADAAYQQWERQVDSFEVSLGTVVDELAPR